MSKLAKTSPALLLLISYCLAIALGAALLLMPFSTVAGHLSAMDALFTATSAVCVTGLTVVDTGSAFTLTGQLIILTLIQLGGLGIMTFSVALFLSLKKRVPYRHRRAMQDVFAASPRRDIHNLVKSVFLFTLLAEAAGAGLLFAHFHAGHPAGRALYLAVFHSISAFCNAGFALFPDSLMSHRDSLLVNFTVGGLIVLGGLGFPVVYELFQRFRGRGGGKRLSLNSKVVLSTTGVLIAAGAVIFALLEEGHSGMPFWSGEFWLTSFFQSITARTAGFNTVDMAGLGTATLTFITFLMFFGASPGSCGGGLKTTTLAVLTLYSIGRLRRRPLVNMFKKTVPAEYVGKAISLFLLSISLIGLAMFLLLVAQEPNFSGASPNRPFLTYLFETVSAFGTVGLSMGITSGLDVVGKALIVLLMLVGRLGVPSFTYLLLGGDSNKQRGPHYAEERLMLG